MKIRGATAPDSCLFITKMTTTTLHANNRALYHKIPVLGAIKINWKLFYLSAIAASLAMLIMYIYMVNQLIQGAYVIKNYNKDVAALLKENKVLEVNFAESGFLAGVQEKARELSFEKTTGVTYIKVLQNSLAEAK